MLHITNGDSAAVLLQRAGVPGVVLAWRDILHEGPVPAGLTLAELSEARARFIADSGWGAYGDARHEFRHRDGVLQDVREHEEVVLWFEHDLYDQLQLLQLLDWFSGQERGATRLSLLCIDDFPGVAPFLGIGQLTPAQILTLYPRREPVTDAMLALGRAAWAAYRAPAPWALEAMRKSATAALPFLAPAFSRHLEQFPAVRDGLSRTDRQILRALDPDPQRPRDLFVASQRQEETPFMGDLPLWSYVHRMAHGPAPLVGRVDGGAFVLPGPDGPPPATFLEQQLALTDDGRAVLAGRADAIRLNGIDRWLGGVRLQGPEAAWRWDTRRGAIVDTGATA